MAISGASLEEQLANLENYNARFLLDCIASVNSDLTLNPKDVVILAEQAGLPTTTPVVEILDELLKRYTLKRVTRRLKS